MGCRRVRDIVELLFAFRSVLSRQEGVSSRMTENTQLPLFEDWSPQMGIAEHVDGNWSRPGRVACGPLPIHPGSMGVVAPEISQDQ